MRLSVSFMWVMCVSLGLLQGCISEVALEGALCSGAGEFCGGTKLLCQQGTCQQIQGPLVTINECADDNACSAETPHCQPFEFLDQQPVKLCVECVTDADCSGPTPVCASGVLSALPKCLGCITDSQCDTVLCSSEYQCIPCTANGAVCNGERQCNVVTGVCEEAVEYTTGRGEE